VYVCEVVDVVFIEVTLTEIDPEAGLQLGLRSSMLIIRVADVAEALADDADLVLSDMGKVSGVGMPKKLKGVEIRSLERLI
jgi:hypothetical protein